MRINIHVHHHITADGEVLNRLNTIIQKLDQIMTNEERLIAALAKLDEGTTEIAKDLKALKEQITNGNVSEETLNKLDSNIAILEQLGKDQ